ncbi:MAG: hypothetical protein K0S37_760 [Microbacterium sp.]|jgi:hypothetical protein|nr:hypothetical protein [Microbacterium sp.]
MQRDNLEAVKQALNIYRHADKLDPAWRLNAVTTLGKHGLWSLTQIVAISGVPMHDVRRTISKSDHTGGRFNPDTLSLLVEEFELRSSGGLNDALTARIIQEGTSLGMTAKLLGVTPGTIRTQLERSARNQGGTQ